MIPGQAVAGFQGKAVPEVDYLVYSELFISRMARKIPFKRRTDRQPFTYLAYERGFGRACLLKCSV